MLDKDKVKKGDRVYRLEWVDLFDDSIGPQPRISAYQITELGAQFAAVREIYQGPKLKGQLGGQFKTNTKSILAMHYYTPEEAVAASVRGARRLVEEAERHVLRTQANEKLVRALAERMGVKP